MVFYKTPVVCGIHCNLLDKQLHKFLQVEKPPEMSYFGFNNECHKQQHRHGGLCSVSQIPTCLSLAGSVVVSFTFFLKKLPKSLQSLKKDFFKPI
jgi:hypothetical protein